MREERERGTDGRIGRKGWWKTERREEDRDKGRKGQKKERGRDG